MQKVFIIIIIVIIIIIIIIIITIVHIYSLPTSWTFNKFMKNNTLFQRPLEHKQIDYRVSSASEYRLLAHYPISCNWSFSKHPETSKKFLTLTCSHLYLYLYALFVAFLLETSREVGVLSKGMILEDECKTFWVKFCFDVDVPLEILGLQCWTTRIFNFLTPCFSPSAFFFLIIFYICFPLLNQIQKLNYRFFKKKLKTYFLYMTTAIKRSSRGDHKRLNTF